MQRQSFRYIAKVRENLIRCGEDAIARRFNGGKVYCLYLVQGFYHAKNITEILMNGQSWNIDDAEYILVIGDDEASSRLNELNTYLVS